MPKMNVKLYVIEDYENETTLRLQKNKPNLKTEVRRQKSEDRSQKTEFGPLATAPAN